MTIEIHKPELEALINERLQSGAFDNVEMYSYKPFRVRRFQRKKKRAQEPIS